MKKSKTPSVQAGATVRVQRLVRRLVSMLLGERNAANLYGEDNTAEQFENAAKQIGATVIASDLETGVDPLLHRVIDPLSYAKKEQGKKKQNQVTLRDGLGFDGNDSHRASAANDCEGVPPVIYLQPGERITHIMVMLSPNYLFSRNKFLLS
jgi:hypothetical protein